MKKNILIMGMAVFMAAGGMFRAKSQGNYQNQRSGQFMTMGSDIQAMKQDTLQMLEMKEMKGMNMHGTKNTKMEMHSKMNNQGEMSMDQCMMMMKKMKGEDGMSMHKSMEGKGNMPMHNNDSAMMNMNNHKSHQQMMECMTDMHQQMMEKMVEMQSKCAMKSQPGESKSAPEKSLKKDAGLNKLEPNENIDVNKKLNIKLRLY